MNFILFYELQTQKVHTKIYIKVKTAGKLIPTFSFEFVVGQQWLFANYKIS